MLKYINAAFRNAALVSLIFQPLGFVGGHARTQSGARRRLSHNTPLLFRKRYYKFP